MDNKMQLHRKDKGDFRGILRKSWYRLRLSVRHPSRVPTWDAIVLTAASPEQAELYQWQLRRAKRMGRIAASTVTLAVPDPEGKRIGSGAATLNAIYALARHYHNLEQQEQVGNGSNTADETFKDGANLLPVVNDIAKRHILLLHAGGDSKRVPWANPMGKVFLPLPFLASDDPDGPVPLLFDHILAISSCARQAFKDEGGLFIMTGDVLPLFDASTMVLPDDASCIITVPITLDIASNHGVVVASRDGIQNEDYQLSLVENLLQKPSAGELVRENAILDDGRTLLDTGIIAARGKAWEDLVMLSYSSQPLISELLGNGNEMSLYEDLVAAWVPTKHEWLLSRPLGQELVSTLGSQKMFSYCAYDLSFLHFGTSSEVLDHLSVAGLELVGRRHLCSLPATTVSDIAASSIILSSNIAPEVSIGDDSLVYDSTISCGTRIGSLAIVVGLNMSVEPFKFILPDRHCIWEVPLVGCTGNVIVYCGLHDNPKSPISKDGTFCGRPWKRVLDDLLIQEADLWGSTATQEKCLWTAKVFPILPYIEMLKMANWLMGLNERRNQWCLSLWRRSLRVSLEELHQSIDFQKMCSGSENHQADLAADIAKACLSFGLLGRNILQLCQEVLQKEATGVEICNHFLEACTSNLQGKNSKVVPKSRAYQVQVDLYRACNNENAALELEHKVSAAVAEETASAVRYGFKDILEPSKFNRQPSKWADILESSKFNRLVSKGNDEMNQVRNSTAKSFCHRIVKVELPVRVDFVGGWSDTPPWSLERAGCVLNMAINLEGSLPIGAIIETSETYGIVISDDASNELHIKDLTSIAAPFDSNDPFRLVKSAVLVTGKVSTVGGLRIRTWANVPRGSGLGTSSILAAAVVKGLLQISEGDDSNTNVARLVLLLEQMMGTGGGWQDQIGGLYPGIKFTASYPGVPLRLQVVPLLASPMLISELNRRLLIVFTGQVRLAHQVLQKVVTRYLRRDNLLILSIKRLAELAKVGRDALMNCDIDQLGEIMMEAWRLHQELDPYCSNEFVDKLFAFADSYCSGYKLVGAGGGGFALLLAKDVERANHLRSLLEQDSSEFGVKVYNWEVFLES